MSHKPLKLLLADDEPWIIENLKTLISWKDLSIELIDSASDGEDALRKFKDHQPDIIITDINMPFMDGNELIEQVKSIAPAVQIIVLSGYDDFSYVRQALIYGAVDYLLKPVTKTSLIDVLNRTVTAITEKNRDEEQKVLAHEKLLQAGSLITDAEYSQLLYDDLLPDKQTLISELELEYSMYSMVLFKIAELNTISRKRDIPLHKLVFNLKKEIKKLLGISDLVLFNNIYSRSDFILLMNADRTLLERINGNIIESLEKRFGTRVCVYISNAQYSFEKFSFIYSEGSLALSLRHFKDKKNIFNSDSAKKVDIRKRMLPEQERKLLFAIESRNKVMIRDIIYYEIGFNCSELQKWLILEVHQTLEHIIRIFQQVFQTDADIILLLENYQYMMQMALQTEDYDELCSLIEQVIEDTIPDSRSSNGAVSMKKTIESVSDYIDENYFSSISLSSLSSQFAIDRSYLCRSFKAVTGENLMSAISRKRIEKAQEYIRQSILAQGSRTQKELSLTDISDLVGYEEYSYFNKVFRKITGVSPSDYKAGLK